MRRKDFYPLVERTKLIMKWKLTKGQEIRATKRIKGETVEFCPITAVHFMKTGVVESINNAEDLGVLDSLDSEVIISGADWTLSSTVTDKEDKIARKTLLRRLGLKEKVSKQ